MTLPLEPQIRELFAKEQAEARPAVTAADIPANYECITDEWLTGIVCRDVPGAQVVAHELDEPDEGTNNRRRIELEYNAAGQQAGLPASVFCKATSGLRNRLMLAHSGAIRCEVGFYKHVRPHVDFEVPFAFHADYDPRSFNSIIVLEDLRGKGRFLDLERDGSPELMREQLSLLAKLHGRWAGAPDLAERFAALPTWEERFRGLMIVNLERACREGLEHAHARALVPPRLWDNRDRIWPATLASLETQARLPRGLGHGDVHLHNWYRLEDGTLGLGDWGVVHRGHWGRDLAYCLVAGLSVDERRASQDELLAHYLAELKRQGGQDISLEDAKAICRQAIMTALAFWTMTVAPVPEMPDMQPPKTALAFTARLAAAVDDWESLDAF
ncbi:hypothetical protein U8326_03530 [Tsuneonella sp. CC-YZS046]|uniref:hypothetical protein n=1 Tax=Tsuneonella sp. CC-YZS046 TaxID=3042152 RepID=UPI002D77B5E4|nr:hypothetical protein [Tsuneonella sp. CC-YZS046]WRO67253.1 hypothetical protein U8326_03530 [Tsuneonella sp. CC-YZS046]